MTIEQKMNTLFKNIMHRNVENWEWHRCKRPQYIQITPLEHVILERSLENILIDMIGESNDVECLTSKSQYIRECKKWIINHDINGQREHFHTCAFCHQWRMDKIKTLHREYSYYGNIVIEKSEGVCGGCGSFMKIEITTKLQEKKGMYDINYRG